MWCVSFGNISFIIGPLYSVLISAWLSLAGSRHSLTFLLTLSSDTKLLHHSDVLSTFRATIIDFCNLSISSSNGFCNAYLTCLRGAWYSMVQIQTGFGTLVSQYTGCCGCSHIAISPSSAEQQDFGNLAHHYFIVYLHQFPWLHHIAVMYQQLII